MEGNEETKNNSFKPELSSFFCAFMNESIDDGKNPSAMLARTTLHVQSHLYTVSGVEH